jgi:NAD(P)H-hydrate epimerase
MVSVLADAFTQPCWIVDALFGTGLTRPLGAPYDQIVALVNASRRPVLAVDIPSGLDCDTGEPLGPTIRATHTATFVAPKKGFLNPAAKPWLGEVHVSDIGAPKKLVDEFLSRSQQSGVRSQ